MACNQSKTATTTTTQVHSGGGHKVVKRDDEGYFWNIVTGLDTRHQTAVLALKRQATLLWRPQTRDEFGEVVAVATESLFTCGGSGCENSTG